MKTVAEIQQVIEESLLKADAAQKAYSSLATTLATVSARIIAIRDGMLAAGTMLPYAETNPEVGAGELYPQARLAAQEETRFWLTVMVEAVPRMIHARKELEAAVAATNALQAEVRPHLERLQRSQGAGAVGNPPGASPGIDLKA